MTSSFSRTVGPKADVAELEYLAALHQTSTATRPTGTVSSLDIQRLLKSRHGLDITQAQARDIVIKLGGGTVSTRVRRDIANQVAERLQERLEALQLQKGSPAHRQRWQTLKQCMGTSLARSNTNQLTTAIADPTEEIEHTQQLLQEIMSPAILYLDIVQLTSILLIPTLTRMARDYKLKRSKTVEIKGDVEANMFGKQEGEANAAKNQEQETLSNPETGGIEVTATTSKELGVDDKPLLTSSPPTWLFSPIWQLDDLAPQPPDLLEVVLYNLWAMADATGSTTAAGRQPPQLSPALIRTLLQENGEMERANDDELIQRMMQVAGGDVLDANALSRALTADLSDWEVGVEDRPSTYVFDVFGVQTIESFNRLGESMKHGTGTNHSSGSNNKGAAGDSKEPAPDDGNTDEAVQSPHESNELSEELTNLSDKLDDKERVEDTVELARVTANGATIIDQVVDQHASTLTLLLAWMAYICHTATWGSLILSLDVFQFECDEETFGCILSRTVLSWVTVAVILCVFGFVVLIPLLYGNHPDKRHPSRMLLATFFTVFVTISPIPLLRTFSPLDETDVDDESAFDGIVILTTSIGSFLVFQYFFYLLIGLAQNCGYELKPGGCLESFINQTSNMTGTTRMKHAATRKLNTLLANARSMHGTFKSIIADSSLQKSQSDTVFQNFTLKGERRVEEGNLFWVWKRIFTGELFDTEGIWLPSRLLIFQFGQMIISVFVLFFIFILVERAAEQADKARDDLNPDLPDWFVDFVPTGNQVRWALIPAASVSVAVCFFLLSIYIPSTVKTVLKYRCGQLRALGDINFQLARAGPDAAYMNTANAIYGTFAAAGLFFFLVGLGLFLFVWPFSRPLMILILGWGIGLGVTIMLKMVMTSFCRKRFFRAFYRVYPGRSNLASLALECWFIGLGGGVLIGRITQFLLASAFWVGRIDEPFLADNVSLVGYKFDYVPVNYIKEILVHEAHRHPYLERLSTMYLMRLKYKSFASSDACGAWRQLFVLTLLPWLMKYRVYEEQRCLESLQDQASEKEVEMDEDRDALAETANEILANTIGLGTGAVDMGAQLGQAGLDAVDKGTRWIMRSSF